MNGPGNSLTVGEGIDALHAGLQSDPGETVETPVLYTSSYRLIVAT